MKTTLTQIELAGEVLDLTDFATQEGVNALGGKIDNIKIDVDLSPVAKESTLSQGVAEITNKLDQILNTNKEFTWEQF